MIDLSNQIAVITGGSRGIGAATALLLAQSGADIAIVYTKNKNLALKTASKVENHGRRCLALEGSIQNPKDCARIIEKTMKKFGRIDLLINSAGIWEYGKIGEMSHDNWRKTISVNLDGTFNMCNAVVPIMKRQKYGRIVNVSSTAGQRGEAFHSHYAASKGGINAFTKSLGAELIGDGIWVNSVAPGWVDTDMVSGVMRNSKEKKEIFRSIPRGKVASSEEIAGPILFLCSTLADHIVGEIININGGSVMCG